MNTYLAYIDVLTYLFKAGDQNLLESYASWGNVKITDSVYREMRESPYFGESDANESLVDAGKIKLPPERIMLCLL